MTAYCPCACVNCSGCLGMDSGHQDRAAELDDAELSAHLAGEHDLVPADLALLTHAERQRIHSELPHAHSED